MNALLQEVGRLKPAVFLGRTCDPQTRACDSGNSVRSHTFSQIISSSVPSPSLWVGYAFLLHWLSPVEKEQIL